MNKNMGKRILAVLAGMLTIMVLSIVTDLIMEQAGVFPSMKEQQEIGLFEDHLLALALLYRWIYAVVGGFVTARLAPDQKLRLAIILGGIGVILNTAGAIVMWDKSSHWYPIALIITSIPCAWLGAKWFLGKQTIS